MCYHGQLRGEATATCLEQELAHPVAAPDLQASDPGVSTLIKEITNMCDKLINTLEDVS
jgi:hypothetical protein